VRCSAGFDAAALALDQGGQGEVAGVEWRDASEVAAAWASGDAGFVPRTAVYGAILSEAIAGLGGSD